MADREKVLMGLKVCSRPGTKACFYDVDECPYYYKSCRQYLMEEAFELLQEQDKEIKRILQIVWDTLHEGLSIDTVPDQDWVYERIRNRIEGTYDET